MIDSEGRTLTKLGISCWRYIYIIYYNSKIDLAPVTKALYRRGASVRIRQSSREKSAISTDFTVTKQDVHSFLQWGYVYIKLRERKVIHTTRQGLLPWLSPKCLSIVFSPTIRPSADTQNGAKRWGQHTPGPCTDPCWKPPPIETKFEKTLGGP